MYSAVTAVKPVGLKFEAATTVQQLTVAYLQICHRSLLQA